MTNSAPIAIIMPPREGFSPQAFGAVSLSVKDFTEHSRFGSRSVVLGQRTEPPYAGIAYEALPVKRHWYEPNHRAYIRAIMQRFATLKPCLIEVHNRPILALKIAAKTNTPIALHLHNDPQEMKYAKTPKQRRHLLSRCAAIYCISHWARARFLEGLSEGHEKVHTVHSGIAVPEAPLTKEHHIVYVGRMTPNKGALEYAQALARILPEHADWHGYMIGGRRHEPSVRLSIYEKKILEVIETAGRHAHFEGFYPFEKTQSTFRHAHIVVVPSLWEETFGRTALEAIAQGCAVITSGRGGLKEIIGDAGITIADVTGQSIADAIETLIRSPETLAELQRRAHLRAQKFDIQLCTNRLDEIRASIIEPPHKQVAHAA